MKHRNRVLGGLFALAITLGYAGAVVARPQFQICGDAAYYCGKIFGHGSWVCAGVC